MSKSLGNILDPIEIINNYGIDQLRYYLMKEVSLGNDGSISMLNLKIVLITISQIIMKFMSKSFSFIKKNCNNKIPKSKNLKQNDLRLINNITENIPDLIDLINKQT